MSLYDPLEFSRNALSVKRKNYVETVSETENSQVPTPDPHEPPYDFRFPSYVNDVGQPGVASQRPYIDFIIEQYNGSQFTKSEGLMSELATMVTRPESMQAFGEIASQIGLGGAMGVNLSEGEEGPVLPKGAAFGNMMQDVWSSAKGFMKGAKGTVADIQNYAQTPSSKKAGSMGKGAIEFKGKIRLYLPHSIQEQFAATWAEEDVSLAGAMAIGGIDAMADVANHMGTEGKRVLGDLLGGADVLANPALANILMRQDGMALNNHLEAFFKGVGFRKFSYTFQLSPKTPKEAQEIQQIVKAFKVAASPALATPGEYYGRFFKYPNQFNISYWNSGQTHQLSKCVLESISVNYSAGQSNMTFRDNRPLQTDLTLNFKELEIMHKQKFLDGY